MKAVTIRIVASTGCTEECIVSYSIKAPWRVTLQSKILGMYSSESDDLFQCLCDIRLQLEAIGSRIACAGARIDAFPPARSRMQSGGSIVELYSQRDGGSKVQINIFDDAPIDLIATVNVQAMAYRKFLESNAIFVGPPPPAAVAQALECPNGWIYMIDGNLNENDDIPPDRIIGAWRVNDSGIITGDFVPNPNSLKSPCEVFKLGHSFRRDSN